MENLEQIKKILQSRKIHKDRINHLNEFYETEKKQIEKYQKPVTDAIKEEAEKQRNQDAILAQNAQSNQELSHMLLNKIASKNPTAKALQFSDAESDEDVFEHSENSFSEQGAEPEELLAEPEAKSTEGSSNDKWVQGIFEHRGTHGDKATSLEMQMDGKIGERGQIDRMKLFNKNIISVQFDDRHNSVTIPKEKTTPGLIALLLLHYNEMQKANIVPTEVDKRVYFSIMQKAGYKQSKNKKYKEYLTREFRGRGLFVYSSPKDLENKLSLLVASIRAGNTSQKIKEEVRAIVDELLKLKRIPSTMHEMFYNKFHLM